MSIAMDKMAHLSGLMAQASRGTRTIMAMEQSRKNHVELVLKKMGKFDTSCFLRVHALLRHYTLSFVVFPTDLCVIFASCLGAPGNLLGLGVCVHLKHSFAADEDGGNVTIINNEPVPGC